MIVYGDEALVMREGVCSTHLKFAMHRLVQRSMVARECILMMLFPQGSPRKVDIEGLEGNVFTTMGWIAMKMITDIHAPLRIILLFI